MPDFINCAVQPGRETASVFAHSAAASRHTKRGEDTPAFQVKWPQLRETLSVAELTRRHTRGIDFIRLCSQAPVAAGAPVGNNKRSLRAAAQEPREIQQDLKCRQITSDGFATGQSPVLADRCAVSTPRPRSRVRPNKVEHSVSSAFALSTWPAADAWGRCSSRVQVPNP